MNHFTFQGDMELSNRTLYTSSNFARKNLLHLQEIGSLRATSAHTNKREHLASYLFFMVKSGSGALIYENVVHPLSSGDCVFIDCQFPYAHSTYDDLWQLRWVHFQGPNMNTIYHKYVERGGTSSFHPSDFMRYDIVLDSIEDILISDSHVKDMSINERLSSLLVLLMEDSWHQATSNSLSTKRQSLQHIREYLDNHYQERLTLDELADKFYINKYYMTRIFKEQFGLTINTYLQQARITRAKQMLRFSDLPIDKIGADCGLNDANYFSRVFKKVEGISPGEFRKIW